MTKLNSIILAAVSCVAVSSCQIEGPLSDLSIHNAAEARDELKSFSVAASDGVVGDNVLTVVPQLIADVDGDFVNDIYLSYCVDEGESVQKGPIETGRPVRYDLDWKVWTPGTHSIEGKLFSISSAGGKTVLSSFSDSFTVTQEDDPPVEEDYLVSIVRGSSITPLHTTETATLKSGADCTLKIDFKGQGTGKVSIKNIDYTFSLLDFDFAQKFEGEGLATIPFSILKTGTAFVTVTFARGDSTYKPTFQISIQL